LNFLQVASEDDHPATMADIFMGYDISPSAVVVSGPAEWEINGAFLGHSGKEIKSTGPIRYSPPTTYHVIAIKWRVLQLFKEAIETGITGGCLVSSLISMKQEIQQIQSELLAPRLVGSN
jgi:hypothetical protein